MQVQGRGIVLFFLRITGTWEGWVATTNDLYLYGKNPSGVYCYSISDGKAPMFSSQTIDTQNSGTCFFKTTLSYIQNAYKNFVISLIIDKNSESSPCSFYLYKDNKSVISSVKTAATGNTTITLPIKNYIYTGPFYFSTWSYFGSVLHIYSIQIS